MPTAPFAIIFVTVRAEEFATVLTVLLPIVNVLLTLILLRLAPTSK